MKRGNVYHIVLSGLLVALSVVLTRLLSADLIVAGVPASRLAVGFLPIMLSGMLSGPFWGAAVGAAADALGFLLFPKGTYFPGLTLTSALVGVLPALIMRASRKLPLWAGSLLSVTVTQTACSMFLNTFWLTVLYGKAFQVLFGPRAVVILAMMPLYYAFVYPTLLGLIRANVAENPSSVPLGRKRLAGACSQKR